MKRIPISQTTKIRFVSAVIVAGLLFTLPVVSEWPVYATTAQEIKEQAEKDLNKTNNAISGLEEQQNQIQGELNDAGAQLEALLSKQKSLKDKIVKTQKQVKKANIELKKAEKKQQEEYDTMKLRIQYMYENSSDTSIWTAILESKGFSDMLNRMEYISSMYKSDRELLEEYEQAVKDVKDLTERLSDRMDKLLAMQEDYENQQAQIEKLIASLKDKKEKYAAQLADAKKQAEDFQKTIDEQGRIIQQQEAEAARRALEAERRRKEAEEQRKREEEERRQQEAQQQQQNENEDDNPSSYDGGGAGESGLGDEAYLSDPTADPSSSTDVSGADVVAYARKFVGNPYRWGGNSLTNGVDCSGFVHLVYQHFGISTPRYSQAFKTVGKAVSYSNMKAGDVVVYPGHVAIYMGNGKIVEAQSTRAGITETRSVDCHTISAIRRLT